MQQFQPVPWPCRGSVASSPRVDRLARLVVQIQIARAELAAERAVYDARVTEWYENGCPGERPELSHPPNIGQHWAKIVQEECPIRCRACYALNLVIYAQTPRRILISLIFITLLWDALRHP